MKITRGFCTILLPIHGICHYYMRLDEVVLNLEHVRNPCLYYLINSPDDKGKKEETGKELNRLDAYCRDFAWHKQFIAEKAFYFKGFLESLHGESERAANGKLLTSPTKEV